MTVTQILLACLAVLCSTAGQLLFKAGSARNTLLPALPFLGCGACCMGASVLICVVILQTAALSALVPFAALAYVTTPLGALFIFKEKVRPGFWIGVGFICLGVGLTMLR